MMEILFKSYLVAYGVGALLFGFAYFKAYINNVPAYFQLRKAFENPLIGFVNSVVTLYVFPRTAVIFLWISVTYIVLKSFALLLDFLAWTIKKRNGKPGRPL